MITGVISQLIPWELLAGLVAGLVALLSAWVAGRRGGAVRAEKRATAQEAKKRDAGRKGEAEAKADLSKGKTPADIVRDNDGAWK